MKTSRNVLVLPPNTSAKSIQKDQFTQRSWEFCYKATKIEPIIEPWAQLHEEKEEYKEGLRFIQHLSQFWQN